MDFLMGLLLGVVVFYLFADRKEPSGTFIIDFSDPNSDVCRLVWDEDLNDICMKKQVVLNVETIGMDSHE